MWAAWSNFYSGVIDDRRLGRYWAVFVPARTDEPNHQRAMEGHPRDDDLESYPGASYTVENGRAAFEVSVLLIYHVVEVDALDLDITVEAEPHVKLSLWVEQRNV